MAYFAIKTSFGFKKVSEEDADFHIETIEEYYRRKNTARYAKETIAELQNLKAELEEKILELENENDGLKEEYVNAYKDGVFDEQEYVERERKENALLREKIRKALHDGEMSEGCLSDANKAVDRLESLNAHFIRVAKERANQQNGKSKKDGSGYVVTTTIQVKDKVENQDYRYDQHETINAWRTTIKTPYNASLLYEDIRKEIRTDLIDTVLGPMGIDILQKHEKNGEYLYPTEIDNSSDQDHCMVYRWIYRANYRDGFWEIDIYHDKPIYVPEELRSTTKTINPAKKEGDKNA